MRGTQFGRNRAAMHVTTTAGSPAGPGQLGRPFLASHAYELPYLEHSAQALPHQEDWGPAILLSPSNGVHLSRVLHQADPYFRYCTDGSRLTGVIWNVSVLSQDSAFLGQISTACLVQGNLEL